VRTIVLAFLSDPEYIYCIYAAAGAGPPGASCSRGGLAGDVVNMWGRDGLNYMKWKAQRRCFSPELGWGVPGQRTQKSYESTCLADDCWQGHKTVTDVYECQNLAWPPWGLLCSGPWGGGIMYSWQKISSAQSDCQGPFKSIFTGEIISTYDDLPNQKVKRDIEQRNREYEEKLRRAIQEGWCPAK
jgi:hypothetical protein